MGLLLYKSNEMFSSTELIRKSKTIFNKIIDKEIEKAIIMRDGKPGFLLMDFAKYEEIMTEFEELKSGAESKSGIYKPVKNKLNKKVIIDNKPIKDIPKIEDVVELKEDLKETKIKIPPTLEKQKVKIQASQVIPPRPIKEEIIVENKDETIIEEKKTETISEENIFEDEISEEEEIKKALESIKSMNFDENMKSVAEKKIKERIIEARRNRAKQKEQEDKDNRVDLKEELEIQVHIKEKNMKKERELKEFWD